MGSQRDAPLTVTFPIPRKAASMLRTMAVSRDRRLLDLGVLAVQINEGESIVLGIKLGKQRIKKTEVTTVKLRGNASRGRVKKASARRNVATIHHMPNDFNSQAPIAHGLQTMQDLSFGNDIAKKKKVFRSDGDIVGNNLFNNSSKPPQSCNHFRKVSDFTTSSIASSLNGHSSSADLSAHLNNNSQDNSDRALEEGLINSGSVMQKTVQKPSASPASVLSRKTSVESLVSHGALSSPASQRTYSASPSSDTSSASSEENFDHHHDQLIYDCFVDRSKYSAADVLKELAKTHEVKKSTGSTSVVSIETHSVTSTVTIVKSTSSGMYPLKQSRSLNTSSNRRSVISGSYREHVRNIRCNSLTCLTATTSTVSATLKTPASSVVDQSLGLQTRGTSADMPLTFGDRIQSSSNQLSSQDNNSQTSNIKATSSTVAEYHGGHKVLWSSANSFPKSDISFAHFLFDKSVGDFAQGSLSSNKNTTLLSKVQETGSETTVRPSCVKSDAVTWSDDTNSLCTATSSYLDILNKLPEQDHTLKGINASKTDTKTVINKMPTLSFNSQALALSPSHQTSSSHVPAPAKSSSFLEATSTITTVCNSTAVVQNLTLGRPAAIPTPLVIAGSNTQTTWSNQQVSPTYFVGAQRQYGIYSALYNSDVNNNQLGQQAVSATYPLNYVYPLSFVYPFLTMAAQASDSKSSESSEHENKNLPVKQNDVAMNKTGHTKTDSNVCTEKTSVSTADVTQTTNTATPPQMQFIDLASSMRYWQQLSFLYRSRLQALASCNLSNVKALNLNSNQINMSGPATTVDSQEGTKISSTCENAVKSKPEELSFSKPEISQANSTSDSTPAKTQTSDFLKENPCSESLRTVKPESKFEDKNGLNNTNAEGSSFVVPSSCRVVSAGVKETLKSSVKVDNSKQMKFHSNGSSSESVSFGAGSVDVSCSANPPGEQVRHTNDDSLDGSLQENKKQNFYGSPPKLSFIHDSSIACVNVGSSNGNGLSSNGVNSGVRKTGFGTHLDMPVRPAKRRKSKKSL